MLETFDAPYMQRALAAGLLVAVPLALLGCWVVLRGLAFYAHGVGVATFPGVVLGVAVPALGPFLGALLAALGFSAAISVVETDHRVRGGAVIGLLLAVALALGAVGLTVAGAGAAPVESLLFGSLLAVAAGDVAVCAAAALLGVTVVAALVPRLSALTFDEEWSARMGARDRQARAIVLGLIALLVVCALPAVGSLLVSALLVVPPATARLLTERLEPMLAWSVGLGAAEVFAGLLASRAFDLPPGAAVATVAGVAFAGVAVARAAADSRWRQRPAG